ncbi:hypothetical protein RDABS01_022048, partial [Bienertia sinuspersici]
MGKSGKRKEQSEKPVNEYEKMRMLRIQENKLRLQELGVKEISKSLRSLCGSQEKKKAKVNEKTHFAPEIDLEYNPGDHDEVSDEDTRVGHFKKVTRGNGQMHRLQFIPPGSMKNFANVDHYHECEDLCNYDRDDSDNEQVLLGPCDGDELSESEDETENVGLEIEDLEQVAIHETKKRGPTMMHHVHTREFDKHKVIIFNELGQPIGPVTQEEDTVGEFSRFLGTIARDYSYAPLTIRSWHDVPHKEKMWEYVLLKYIVPIEGKEWVMKSIRDAWRVWKCRFKKKHYYRWKNDKERWEHRSNRIPDDEFLKLLAMWKKKNEQERCMSNKERRLSQKNMHTVGPKSFARIREEMRNEHPNKELPSLADTFERTRRRTEGRIYKDSYDDTTKKLEATKSYVPPEDGSGPTDPYLGTMSKDPNGRRRIYGRGLLIKIPREFVESIKATIVEEVQKDMESEIAKLDDTRKKLEEDHMKKKAELEDKQRELESERNNIFEEVMRKIVGRLPSDIAKQYL